MTPCTKSWTRVTEKERTVRAMLLDKVRVRDMGTEAGGGAFI